MSLTVRVVPVLDSRAVDVRKFSDVKVYRGEIENEIFPPSPPPAFPAPGTARPFLRAITGSGSRG